MDCERLPRNQPRSKLRQLSFSLVLEMSKEMLRHHELQNRIAQKLEALIIEMMLLCLMSHAWMSERFRQQERVAELVTNAVFERVHLGRKSLRDGPDFSKERRSPARRLRRGGLESAPPWLGFASTSSEKSRWW